MEPNDFYRLVNTLLFKAHEKLPSGLIPKDESLVTDYKYRAEIKNIINKMTGLMSKYSPQFEFQVSPFDKEKIVPVINTYESAKMYSYRKTFDLKQVLKMLDVKL